MTYDEARVDRVRDREDWGESDAFEIAVRAFFAGGLIRRQGDLLVPGEAGTPDRSPDPQGLW